MKTRRLARLITLVCIVTAPLAGAQGPSEAGKVLVFGGTGMIGYEIVKALEEQDHDVTVFVRETSNVEDLGKIDVPYVMGDVLEPNTLEQAFRDGEYRTVISSISRSGSFGGPIEGVTIHKTGNNNITAAALGLSAANGIGPGWPSTSWCAAVRCRPRS